MLSFWASSSESGVMDYTQKMLILLSQKVSILSKRGPVLELTAFVCLWNNSIDYIEEVIDAGILGVTNLTGTVYPGP